MHSLILPLLRGAGLRFPSLVLAAVAVAAPLAATPRPHPTRAERLVEERDGVRVEYSAGQEAYVDAVVAAVAAWQGELATLPAIASGRGAVEPGSARDLVAHREEILRRVAAEIGLAEPTALQGRVFDLLLEYYEMMSVLNDLAPQGGLGIARCRDVQIWERETLTRRLAAGEKLEGFSYDPATRQGSFDFERRISNDADQKAVEQRFERGRLDLAFNYEASPDGVVRIDASFTKAGEEGPRPLEPATRDDRWERLREKGGRLAESLPFALPLVLSERTAGRSAAEVAAGFVAMLRENRVKTARGAPHRNPVLLHVLLHEVTEAGVVENYLGSPDRRWWCDGVANYVAWKVMRDRCGAEFAAAGYVLDEQLQRHGALQKQVDLRAWRAVEQCKAEDRDTPLTRAHYAFATRAVFEIARRHGEAALPRLFRKLAETPRARARMATVAQAYRGLFGQSLDELLTEAKRMPVAGGR